MSDNDQVAFQQNTDWNILTSHWLEAMDNDAVVHVISPIEALRRAKEVRCLLQASPLDLFAAYRFLLTLLYWKADAVGGVRNIRESLLRGEMPKLVLERIEADASYFYLFDKVIPFLQDPSLENVKKSDRKSAGSLFAELASGTNIAHFHHGDDTSMRICARCATIGMMRVVPWTQAGGSGLTPSVHNAPPIMALASGSNLAVTLGLNLVSLSAVSGTATWTGHFIPAHKDMAIPYMEAFTWNPRRIHLLSLNMADVCWRCGKTNIAAIGQIVYQKNEDTKKLSDKQLFAWQDPSAFYTEKARYTSKKSCDEKRAAAGDDLYCLLDRQNDPIATVVVENPDHAGWQLIIPCTDPAYNKTFDHRQLVLEHLTQEALHAALTTHKPASQPKGIDGWLEPQSAFRPTGVYYFLQAAAKLLTHADWAVLSAAAYREMHIAPAAFDILSGLLWSLRGKISRLPSRKVAWLMLKLMATVPPQARIPHNDAAFCPLRSLPKRQLQGKNQLIPSPYPVSFPQGHRLESALRNPLSNNMRRRNPERVDWVGLCHGLEQLID